MRLLVSAEFRFKELTAEADNGPDISLEDVAVLALRRSGVELYAATHDERASVWLSDLAGHRNADSLGHAMASCFTGKNVVVGMRIRHTSELLQRLRTL